MAAAQFLTVTQYAAWRGVSPQAVRKALATKRITGVLDAGKVRIDPEVADIQWAKNTDPKQSERANAGKPAAPGGTVAAGIEAPGPRRPGKDSGEEPGNAYWDSRARREAAEAEKAEIELAKLRGSVADREGMHRAAMALGRMLRDSMLGIPPKVAPEYAGMTDPFEIERHLDVAIRRVLDDVAALTMVDLDMARSDSTTGRP